MASSWLQAFVDPRRNPLAAMHYKALSNRLRRYGLRYDDLHDPMYDLDIKVALERLPREVVDARNQRLKRAMDLSMKHEYLPENLQALQTPFRSYLQDMLALRSLAKRKRVMLEVNIQRPTGEAIMACNVTNEVKKERAEREALGALPLYERTIP